VAGLVLGAAGLLALLIAGGGYWLLRSRPEIPPIIRENPPLVPAVQAPLTGYIDALVLRPAAGQVNKLMLSDPESLPLRLGSDYVRIEAKLNRPAYLYIVWVDPDGSVNLVYPWDEEKKCRLPDEKPTQGLFWPDEKTGGFLNPGPAGTSTLLLLAREDKLPEQEDIGNLFGKLAPQKSLQRREAAWFENGEVVKGEKRFAAINFPPDRGVTASKRLAIDDPVMQVQALLRSPTLRQHFAYSRAVCFSSEPPP
jgi:hypothetical protein